MIATLSPVSMIGLRPPFWGIGRGGVRWLGLALVVIAAVLTVVGGRTAVARWTVGGLLVVSIVGLLLGSNVANRWVAGIGVVVGIGFGLAATVRVPSGLAEFPVFSGAIILPQAITHPRLRAVAVAAASVATGVVIMVIGHSVAGLLAGFGVWALAARSHERAELQVERDRAVALLAELEASRQAQAEAAALQERNRIAGEMHDVLAHTLAGLSIQLQAIRAIAAKEGAPASLTEPLDRVASLAREGVAEARSVVGTLRASQPRGVADLPALLEGYPGEAQLRQVGVARSVSAATGHAIFRAVQESLTNTARYATGSSVVVILDWSDPVMLEVCVDDAGLPVGGVASGMTGNGVGLTGMAERIGALGGTVAAGLRSDEAGWRVLVRAPSQ